MAELETRNEQTCTTCGRELAGDGSCISCSFRRRVWLLFGVFVVLPIFGVGACIYPKDSLAGDMRTVLMILLCGVSPLAGVVLMITWGKR